MKNNKQGHGPLSQYKGPSSRLFSVVLGNVFIIEGVTRFNSFKFIIIKNKKKKKKTSHMYMGMYSKRPVKNVHRHRSQTELKITQHTIEI